MANGKIKKVKLPKPEPRAIEEIKNNNAQLTAQIGTCQYLVHQYTKDMDRLLQELENLNREYTARLELDKKATKEVQVPNE